jgi:hypothetical protein
MHADQDQLQRSLEKSGALPTNMLWWQRKGILGWWLNLTAPPRPADMSSLRIREYVRKAELTSVSILAVFAFLTAIISNSLSDPSTAVAAIIMVVVLIITAFLNRAGKVYTAGYLLIIFMVLVVALSILGAKGGLRLTWFITYDLFTIPIFLSSVITHRRTSLIFAFIVAIFIVADYSFQPHAFLNGMGAQHFDEIAYEVAQPNFNWWAMINRNVALVLFSGFFGWLAALSFEKALNWAEQAKGEAVVALAVADFKEQTSQELSQFLNELIEAFVTQANGQTRYLQPRALDDPFYQATILLNDRLRRFESLRRQQAIWAPGYIEQEIQTLSKLLGNIAKGRLDFKELAPNRFHSQVDILNDLAKQIYILVYPHSSYRNNPFFGRDV